MFQPQRVKKVEYIMFHDANVLIAYLQFHLVLLICVCDNVNRANNEMSRFKQYRQVIE